MILGKDKKTVVLCACIQVDMGVGDAVPFALKKGDVRVFRWERISR